MRELHEKIGNKEKELWEEIGKTEAIVECLRCGAGPQEYLIRMLVGICGSVSFTASGLILLLEEREEINDRN